jgi:hypothetical protein
MFTMKLRGLLLLGLVCGLSACGSSTEPTGVLEGTWTGNWVSRSGPGGTVSANISHTGNTLAGTVTFGGSPCFTAGPLQGTMNGTTAATFVASVGGGQQVSFDATVAGSRMSGTYSVSGGPCGGDSGTWVANR